MLNDQPSQYGIIINFPVNKSVELHQIWFEQAAGNVYHRGGNGSGWSGTWKLFSPGTANAAQVLSGYTFSSANGSNIKGSMANRGEYQTAGGLGQGNDYIAMNSIPVGYYGPSNGSWSPEVRYKKSGFGNAYTSGVLKGLTFTSSAGLLAKGTMSDFRNVIQTATTDASNQQKSCYRINGGYIEVVPAIGYWGTWNWGASCIKIPVSTASSVAATYSGQNIVTHNDDGTSTGTYGTTNYVNMSLFRTITVGVNLHGGKDAYGSGGSGTVTCQVKNASGTVLASASKYGSKTGNNAFYGNFTVDVSSIGGSAKIVCTLSASGAHAWKPNNNGKARYTGHAEITGITLS